MVVVPECPRGDGIGDAVEDDLLVVTVKLILPPPRSPILTAFSVIHISLLFFIFLNQQGIIPRVGRKRSCDVVRVADGDVPRRRLVALPLRGDHPNLHRLSRTPRRWRLSSS